MVSKSVNSYTAIVQVYQRYQITITFKLYVGDAGADSYLYTVNEGSIPTTVLLEVEDFNVLYSYMIYERFLHLPLYGMLGAVIITLASNSCSSLCLKTSMCKSPRNPIHHPGPRAALTNETQVRISKTYNSLPYKYKQTSIWRTDH